MVCIFYDALCSSIIPVWPPDLHASVGVWGYYLQRSYPSEYNRYRLHQFIIISIEGSSIFCKASSISFYIFLPVLLSNGHLRITFVLPLLPICQGTYCSVYRHLKVATRLLCLSRSAGKIGVNRLLLELHLTQRQLESPGRQNAAQLTIWNKALCYCTTTRTQCVPIFFLR